MNNSCFVSWSGGKDSCLSLYKAVKHGYSLKKIFTMFSMESGISSAHRLKEDIIKAQANAIGTEHIIGRALFNEYEEVFISNLKAFKEQGIEFGIFGDIDLDEHRDWVEKVCKKADIKAVFPLWKSDRKELVKEFIHKGFKARIILVNKKMIDTKFLGHDLSYALLKEIEKCGADVCGENGEYHTVVYDGPIFKKPVNIKCKADIIPVGDQWAQIEVDI